MAKKTKPLTRRETALMNHLLDDHIIPIGRAIANGKKPKLRHRKAAWRVLELTQPQNAKRLDQLLSRNAATTRTT